jgi:hypothetical protein
VVGQLTLVFPQSNVVCSVQKVDGCQKMENNLCCWKGCKNQSAIQYAALEKPIELCDEHWGSVADLSPEARKELILAKCKQKKDVEVE